MGWAVHNDGRSSTLLQLYGTVPIFYKARQYNIPVVIWLVENYPMHPPTCYVTPTKDMRVKPGHRHVDPMGLIYLPYLNQWNANTSNLAELVCTSVLPCPLPLFPLLSAACCALHSDDGLWFGR
jgi:ESCRT-I complex subunit TSG101